jgi:hypothetical protein
MGLGPLSSDTVLFATDTLHPAFHIEVQRLSQMDALSCGCRKLYGRLPLTRVGTLALPIADFDRGWKACCSLPRQRMPYAEIY